MLLYGEISGVLRFQLQSLSICFVVSKESCMYGSPLEKVNVFTFLGVWFDERLTWAIHIAKTLGKCENVLNVMRSLFGCDWGADRETMILIYQAMIRSSFDYGCFVWGSAAKSSLGKLDVLQARALRLCCGAYRTSPVSALLMEMGEMPLFLRQIQLGLQYWIKLSGSSQAFPVRCMLRGSWEFEGRVKRKPFFEVINQWAGKLGMEQEHIATHANWVSVPYWLMQEVDINLTFLEEEDKSGIACSVELCLQQEMATHLGIFTDGSRDPVSRRAGFGVYVAQLNLWSGLRITDGSSVFATELLAILWALWWVEDVKPDRVLICSDSAAALTALQVGKSKARPDLINEIVCFI